MKNLAYINFVPKNNIGVLKKIEYQIRALEKNSITVEKTYEKNGEIVFKNKNIGKFCSETTKLGKIKRKFQEAMILNRLKSKELYKNVDVVYVRYTTFPTNLYSFFKFLKKIEIKTILEIPTYPYDGEIKNKLRLIIDKYYRKKLYKYVDKIVTFTDDKDIFGIPCINISNGIDLDDVKLIERKKRNEEEIVFTSVSSCEFWHGIDRFLYSMIDYKKNGGKEKILFNIVGEGAETKKLKKIVEDHSEIKKTVIFHGFKSGKELDEIYNETDISLGCLGNHRKNIKELKSLKNREYCAKGLPLIYSECDVDFENSSFIYKVSPTEDLLNIKKITSWYINIKETPKEIREYSKKFSWDIQMKKVIDNID